jgi:hypothetical protein
MSNDACVLQCQHYRQHAEPHVELPFARYRRVHRQRPRARVFQRARFGRRRTQPDFACELLPCQRQLVLVRWQLVFRRAQAKGTACAVVFVVYLICFVWLIA